MYFIYYRTRTAILCYRKNCNMNVSIVMPVGHISTISIYIGIYHLTPAQHEWLNRPHIQNRRPYGIWIDFIHLFASESNISGLSHGTLITSQLPGMFNIQRPLCCIYAFMGNIAGGMESMQVNWFDMMALAWRRKTCMHIFLLFRFLLTTFISTMPRGQIRQFKLKSTTAYELALF